MRRVWFTLALLTASCGGNAPNDGAREAQKTMEQANLSAIGQELGVEFPSSCETLGYDSEVGMDQAWRLKLSCDGAEAERFLAAPPLAELDFRDAERYLLGENEGWWDPAGHAELPTAQLELSGARFLNVGIAKGSEARTTLYLMWHTT